MDIQNNSAVGTPDGDGTVLGQSPEGKIIVRLKTRKEVDPGRKSRTFGGWQDEYDPKVLTPPESNLKR